MNLLIAYLLLRNLRKNKFRMIKEALEWNQKFASLGRTPMPTYQVPEELKHKLKS